MQESGLLERASERELTNSSTLKSACLLEEFAMNSFVDSTLGLDGGGGGGGCSGRGSDKASRQVPAVVETGDAHSRILQKQQAAVVVARATCATESSRRVASSASKIDYDAAARAAASRGSGQLGGVNLRAIVESTATTFVIYENLNACQEAERRRRLARVSSLQQEGEEEEEQRQQQQQQSSKKTSQQVSGRCYSSKIKDSRVQLEEEEEEEEEAATTNVSSNGRLRPERQMKSFKEKSRLHQQQQQQQQHQPQQQEKQYCSKNNSNTSDHLIKLKLRCQDVLANNDRVPKLFSEQDNKKHQKQEKMNCEKNHSRAAAAFEGAHSRAQRTIQSNYSPAAIKITRQQHTHLRNGGQDSNRSSSTSYVEDEENNCCSSSTTTVASNSYSSPLSPPQGHSISHNHSHLLLLNGQVAGSQSTINMNSNSESNTHTSSTSSHKSSATTDSSGFSSEASTTSCGRSSVTAADAQMLPLLHRQQPPQQQQQQQRQSQRSSAPGGCTGESNKSSGKSASLIRSRLIEDLNRLEKIAAAAKAAQSSEHRRHLAANGFAHVPNSTTTEPPVSFSSYSPADINTYQRQQQQQQQQQRRLLSSSQMSTPVTTLRRDDAFMSNVELDYSTLCRDEFSSFIAFDKNQEIPPSATKSHHNHNQANMKESIEQNNNRYTARRRHRARHKSSSSSSSHQHLRSKSHSGGPMLVGVHECETPRVESMLHGLHVTNDASSASSSPATTNSPSDCSDQNNDLQSMPGESSGGSDNGSLTAAGTNVDTNYNHNEDKLTCQEQFYDDDDDDDEEEEEINDAGYRHQEEPPSKQQASPIQIDKLIQETGSNDHYEARIEEYFSDESEHVAHYNQQCQINTTPSPVHQVHKHQKMLYSEPLPVTTTTTYELKLNLLSKNDERESLSEMFDIYLSRVESLLRLAKGDKSVGLDGIDGDNYVEISDEFKTQIAYVPSPRRVDKLPEVIQEIEMMDERAQDGEDAEDGEDYLPMEGKQSFFVTNIVSDNFKALLSGPQTSAKLNWWPNQLEQQQHQLNSGGELLASANDDEKASLRHFIDEPKQRRLEQSFLRKWLELNKDEDSTKENDAESTPSRPKYQYENLVKTVKRHMGEFVANYNTYQATMREETSFACDWHVNWLFSTRSGKAKASQQQQQPHSANNKRAKMMSLPEDEVMQQPSPKQQASRELLHYSTLLLAKYKPLKVAYVDTDYEPHLEGNHQDDDESTRLEGVKYKRQIDTCYEEQLDRVSECQQRYLMLNNKVNLCHLLLRSDVSLLESDDLQVASLDGGECQGDKSPGLKRALEIRYESSLAAGRPMIDGQRMSFSAYGHLFELRDVRQKLLDLSPFSHAGGQSSQMRKKRCRKLDALRQLILARLCRACHHAGGLERKLDLISSELPLRQIARDQVKFLVQISDVKVSAALPVIQFCAKISGALPIRVSWLKRVSSSKASDGGYNDDDDDDGEVSFYELTSAAAAATCGKNSGNQEWPLTMDANYELEYQTDWSSWYKFKRDQDDVLFEIRNANLRNDYGKTYKCVIENYCSIRECEFTLNLCREQEREREQLTPATSRRLLAAVGNSGRCALSKDSRGHHKSKNNNNNNNNNNNKSGKDALRRRGIKRHDDCDYGKQDEEDGELEELGKVRLNRVEIGAGESQEAGQAILRTWSQRTLNKRALNKCGGGGSEQHQAALSEQQQQRNESNGAGAGGQLQTSVGRLSAQVQDDNKFGTNYPYHPVSLMKRLEENKMSLTLGTRMRLSAAAVARNDDDDDDYAELRYYDLTTPTTLELDSDQQEAIKRQILHGDTQDDDEFSRETFTRLAGSSYGKDDDDDDDDNHQINERQQQQQQRRKQQQQIGDLDDEQQENLLPAARAADLPPTTSVPHPARAELPKPRPRQKPVTMVGSTHFNVTCPDQEPPDLAEPSARKSLPLRESGNLNDDNYDDRMTLMTEEVSRDQRQKVEKVEMHATQNNWSQSTGRHCDSTQQQQARSRQSAAAAAAAAASAPPSKPPRDATRGRESRTSSSESDNGDARSVSSKLREAVRDSRSVTDDDAKAEDGKQEKQRPANEEELAMLRPKSVRSLISRFNMS